MGGFLLIFNFFPVLKPHFILLFRRLLYLPSTLPAPDKTSMWSRVLLSLRKGRWFPSVIINHSVYYFAWKINSFHLCTILRRCLLSIDSYFQGSSDKSRRCALCRQDIPAVFLNHPNLLEVAHKSNTQKTEENDNYVWFYEGRNGKIV